MKEHIRKIAIVGGLGGSAAIELAKMRLAKAGMSHIEVEVLTPEDLKFNYPEPQKLIIDDSLIEPYDKPILNNTSGSKYHK